MPYLCTCNWYPALPHRPGERHSVGFKRESGEKPGQSRCCKRLIAASTMVTDIFSGRPLAMSHGIPVILVCEDADARRGRKSEDLPLPSRPSGSEGGRILSNPVGWVRDGETYSNNTSNVQGIIALSDDKKITWYSEGAVTLEWYSEGAVTLEWYSEGAVPPTVTHTCRKRQS